MKTYKIWLSLEEIDEENDEYNDIALEEIAGPFESRKKAYAEFIRLDNLIGIDNIILKNRRLRLKEAEHD